MARLLGPDMGSRAVFLPTGAPAAGKTGIVYTDAAGTILADILAYDGTPSPGSAFVGSVVTVDPSGLLPRFWFPDGVDVLYITVNGGPLVPINADYDARLDTVTTRVTAVEAGGAGDALLVHRAGSETVTGAKDFTVSPTVPTPTTDSQATNKGYMDTALAAHGVDATAVHGIADTAVLETQSGAQAKVDAASTTDRARASHTGTQTAATVSDFSAAADARITAQKAAANGLASLGADTKVPAAQLPSIALTEFLGNVASQVAMLALPGQVGDWAIRTDTSTAWVITGSDPTLVGSWTQMVYPPDVVISVAARTGVVVLAKADVGLGNVDNTADTAKPVSTAQAAANLLAAAKAANLSDLASASTARTNLGLGGAALLAVGTAAGTVAAGNDSRIVNAVAKRISYFDVRDYGAVGDGVADDTVALQAACTAAGVSGGIVLLDKHKITSQVTVTGGVTLTGTMTTTAGSKLVSRITVSIVGGGAALACTGATGINITNVAILSTATSFTGVLVDFTGTSFPTLDTVYLQATAVADLVHLDQATYVTINKVNFVNGNVQVLGKANDASWTNGAAFRDCRFGNGATCHIKNAGSGWLVEGGNVEYIDNGAAALYRHDPGVRAQGLTFSNFWAGDITAPSGNLQIQWAGDGLTIQGCLIGFNNGTLLQVDENDCSGIVVTGNQFSAFANTAATIGVDFGTTTGHSGFVFTGNDIYTPLSAVVNGIVPAGSIMGTTTPAIDKLTSQLPNLMSNNDATLDTSNTQWAAFDFTKNSVARATTGTVQGDIACLVSTTNVAGPQDIRIQSPGTIGGTCFPVRAGLTYTASCLALCGSVARSADIIVQTWNAAGTPLAQTIGPTVAMSTTAWTQVAYTFTAPATAAWLQVQFRIYATLTTETFRLARFSLTNGPVAISQWQRPSDTIGIGSATISRGASNAHAPISLNAAGTGPVGLNTMPGSGSGGVLVGNGTSIGYGPVSLGALKVAEGTNARMGVATLVGGTVVVSTTAVAATSRILVTSQADGGTPGWLRVSARTAGTSFTITSSSGADTSTVCWLVVDPA